MIETTVIVETTAEIVNAEIETGETEMMIGIMTGGEIGIIDEMIGQETAKGIEIEIEADIVIGMEIG